MRISAKVIVNVVLVIGILLSAYFLYLALTPEGYTGIFLFFTYTVHSPFRPALFLAVFASIFVVVNVRDFLRSRAKLRLLALMAAGFALLSAVFVFLDFKRHNRFPWEQPNLLVIVVDTLRADHVSAYGSTYAHTPNFDSLAREGWLFKDAYSHIPITMPSHSSLFTGRLPHDVWVLNNSDDFKYPEPTLAEILKEKGYKTAAAISLGVLKANFNLNRGFDYYNDTLPMNGQWFNRAEVITNRGIRWLDENVINPTKDGSEAPFFLWLHYQDPHEPYCPPDMPPDLAVELNGLEVGSGTVDSAAYVTVKITLQPGENELVFKNLRDEPFGHYFLQLHFVELPDGPFPEAWRASLENAALVGSQLYLKRLADFQDREFLSNFDGLSFAGLRFEEGEGWDVNTGTARRPRRKIEDRASMTIYNTTGEPMELYFRCKGGLHKPLVNVWEDYAAEVEYSDREIGRLLDYMRRNNLMDDTIIVFLSDHGEELDEHGKVGHIHHLYTQSIQVPLIIRDPDSDIQDKKVSRTARIIDIAPTILDMLGIKKPEYMQGKTLMEYVLHNRPQDRELYGETFPPDAEETKYCLLKEDKLAIFSPDSELIRQFEFYDLTADPQQLINRVLTPETAGGSSEFRTKLQTYLSSFQLDDSKTELTAEREEMLIDLGYLNVGDTPTPLTDIGEPGQALLDNVYFTLNDLLLQGATDVEVTAERLGSESSGMHYLQAVITVPTDSTSRFTIMGIQDYTIITCMPQTRQFPLRLIIKAGEKTLLDRILPGDTGNIIKLFSMRLLRLLVHQPYAASIAPAFEHLYPHVNDFLEHDLGIAEEVEKSPEE